MRPVTSGTGTLNTMSVDLQARINGASIAANGSSVSMGAGAVRLHVDTQTRAGETSDPFEPFAIAAVELEREGMVVLGQLVTGVGVDDVTIGQEVELVIETLFEDDEATRVIWKWKPL